MIVTIRNGRAEIRTEHGQLKRALPSNNVVDAALSADESLVVLTLGDGKVQIRSAETGNLKYALPCRDAVRARWQGDEVLIERANGKHELRTERGILRRTF